MRNGCLPQEAELVYLIPTIRKGLTVELSKTMPDKDIAIILGLTKSAISQYLHKKRASEISLPPILNKEIKIAAQKIQSQKSTVIYEITRILDVSKDIDFTS